MKIELKSDISKILILTFLIIPIFVFSDEIEEIQSKINDRNQQILDLEREIATWEIKINEIGEEKQTLDKEVRSLDATIRKLNTDINLNQLQINKTVDNIEDLSVDIESQNEKIDINKIVVSDSIKKVNETESNSLIEILLSGNKLSDFWIDVDEIKTFQKSVNDKTRELIELKNNLEVDKGLLEQKKRELVNYRGELSDKKSIVAYNKNTKSSLLKETKNKEANYQSILDDKLALKNQFESELSEFESQLKFAVDPSLIPDTKEGILKWPLDNIRITQYFGKTSFATANPQVYNGSGHNGIDFGTSTGTKVKSSLSGIVVGTGDTDLVCKGASYGKWVLIEHGNGLSTLYAHLSLIKVNTGQEVNTGDIVGYSGNTGYSTGPHLHYTVYASQGVEVKNYNFKSCSGKSVNMPLADKNAYLNPLSYLPKI